MEALSYLLHLEGILIILGGTILGIIFGALPGFSPITGMALLLPFTFTMEPMTAMILFSSLMGSAHFGGSVSAILLNTPGTTPNACTCLDGFPMAQKGNAAKAISISATSSAIGCTIGLILLLISIPIIRPFLLAFKIVDFFWLIIFGLVTIAFASKGNLLKGLAGGGIGILFAFVGYSDLFAIERYTLGSYYLWDGLKLVPFVVGVFAISEIVVYASKGGRIAHDSVKKDDSSDWGKRVKEGINEVLKRPFQVLRGSLIGSVIGAIPGVGGSAANFISYTVAMQASKHPEEYGKGSAEGLIASETANDAKNGPALLPTVAFGIPGSPDTAILLAALIVHGLQPGPLLLRDDLPIVMMLILGIFISQMISSGTGIFIAPVLAKITFIRVHFLAPFVLIFCALGAFSLRGYIWDALAAVLLGIIGYSFKRFNFPVITIVIGFILGGMAERYFHTSLMISRGSYTIFFTSPISIVLITIMVLMLAIPFVRGWISNLKAKKSGVEIAVEKKNKEKRQRVNAFKNTSFYFTLILTILVLLIIIETMGYREEARLFPLIISIPTFVMLSLLLIGEFYPSIMSKLDVGLETLLNIDEDQSEIPKEIKRERERKQRLSSRLALKIIMWMVGFGASLFALGFSVTIPGFIFTFIIFEGKEKLRKALPITIIGSILLFVAIGYLDMRLWPGAIPAIWPKVIGGGIIPRI